jgi:tetratricopeptide (TPR) repeat protein
MVRTGPALLVPPDRTNIKKAIEIFQAAIEIDPEYARPYAGIADAYNLLGLGCFARPSEFMPAAERWARKAVELNAGLAESHRPLAAFLAYYRWDWPAARREILTALRLNPGYETAHHVYAMAYLLPLGSEPFRPP